MSLALHIFYSAWIRCRKLSAHLDKMTEPFYFCPVLKLALLADLHHRELSQEIIQMSKITVCFAMIDVTFRSKKAMALQKAIFPHL